MNRKEIDKLGGLHSAKIILYSVEFAEIENYQSSNHKINEKSRKIFQKIIEKMQKKGAEGVILGCTEIGLRFISQMSLSRYLIQQLFMQKRQFKLH